MKESTPWFLVGSLLLQVCWLFFDTIEGIDQGSPCDAAALATLAASIETAPLSRRKKTRRGKVILFALLALAVVAFAWLAGISISRTTLERRTDAALQQLTDEQPLLASFPLQLEFDHRNRSLSVSGIEPTQVDIPSLMDGLAEAAAPYRIINRIGVVPGLEQSAALKTEVETVQQSLNRIQASIDEMRKAIAEESKLRDQQYTSLTEQYANLTEQYAGLQALVDGPAERLSRFMASTAVFFGNDDEFANSQEAERQIRQLADLLANNDLRIRIVGHADESGSEPANDILARKRAERVMHRLNSLGIEPARLFIVSRSASMPISDSVGLINNRRVTFENVFRTESPQ